MLTNARITMVLDALTDEATDSMKGFMRFTARIALATAKFITKPKIRDAAIEAMNRALQDQRL